MLITVFTPAYNRASLLPRLYHSLCRQSIKDFEWLIVDDGSVDDTEVVVSSFIKEQREGFNIRYVKKPNGGKHTAINLGVQLAEGELFFIVDSDDSLPDNSIELISTAFLKADTDETLAGVCGYMSHHNGKMIGHYVSTEVEITNTRELQYKYNVGWDMAEVLRTTVLKEIPFPEVEGEKFCPEALVLFRVAKKYNFRLFPSVVYYRDYLDGGLTDNIIRIRMKSPIATTLYYSELNKECIPFWAKAKAAINFYRFYFCLAKGKKNIAMISCCWIWTYPLGCIMHIIDLIKCR